MRVVRGIVALGCAILLGLCRGGVAATAEPLQYDPFSPRPSSSTAVTESAASGTDATSDVPGAPAPRSAVVVAPAPWNARLLATAVVAAPNGMRSSANVDGVVVLVGESVQGYTLVRVEERRAVFERQDRRYILQMDGVP
ncbi:MAG: hypothetical protein KDK91_19405 [Gammaproteobacteria bacterium]|nr:hypothetical protein [Gammaproteobacteria bacterium]